MDLAKKFLHLPQAARISIALGVVFAIFIIIYRMQRTASENEPTLELLCWDPAGNAHYMQDVPVDQHCPDAAPLQWDKNPKLVFWALGPEFDDYKKSHDLAIQWWNVQLDSQRLAKTDNPDLADIIIEQGSVNTEDGSMDTRHQRDADGRIRAYIRAITFADTRQWMLREQHELGHAAFGLAHDPPRGHSIMQRDVSEPANEQQTWFLTTADRNAIFRQ